MNYKQIFAKKKALEQKILKVCPNAKKQSGIYFLVREENGFKYAYIGQALSVLDRLVSHLEGYSQHIDRSLKNHKLYSKENPNGWKIGCLYFPKDELNKKEQEYIRLYANNGYQLRNKTSGSQDGDKFGIAENKPSLGYRDGIKQGEKNMLKKVKVFFEKYLDFVIKDKPNKIKERKYNEFVELLNYEKGVNENEQV